MSLFTKVVCCSKGNTALILGNAIFWAAAMLLAAWFRIGPENDSMLVPGLLTACWFAAQCLLQGRASKCGG